MRKRMLQTVYCIMWLKSLLCLLVVKTVAPQVLYDAYFGKPLTEERNNTLTLLNATSPCVIPVQPCKKQEGRRVDGTCANPRYPSRNGSPTPLLRMLPARFGMGNTLRPAINGSELPSSRLIRTKILSEGYHSDKHFSVLANHVLLLATIDVIDVLYLLRYIVVSECCIGNTPNRVSPDCISIPVPADDPFLRRSGVRCMNLTRFQTFQDFRCISNALPAERIAVSTPLLDLSSVYGYNEELSRATRTFQNGLMRSERRNGVESPPGNAQSCIANQRPRENTCYEFGDAFNGNSLMGIVLSNLWFYREHNRIARRLGEINPCWEDQELFEKAREINIAQWQYIVYYELMVFLLGKQNALAVGIIYETDGYVNDFNDKYMPGVFHEYVLGTRYFHTFQEGRTDLYSKEGKYLGSRTTVDDNLRPGVLDLNNTEAALTQGAFRQPAARFDRNLDPDIAERIHGPLQRAADLGAIDITRGRDHGLQPYNAYRKLCGLPVAHKWEDFKEIPDDKVEQLRRLYEDVDEVELMPAIYSEKHIVGAFVGPTLFCIMTQTLLQWRKSDRHFFEHGDIPTALTLPQLTEIRKANIARVLCDSGDDVSRIQRYPLINIDKSNPIVSCKEIPGVDLKTWTDPKCRKGNGAKYNDINSILNDWSYTETRWNPYIYRK